MLKHGTMYLSFLFSLSAVAAIFGPDSRLLVTPNSPVSAWSQSAAVAVLSGNIVERGDGKFDLDVPRLEDSFCKDQKFVKNPSMSYACSGFLVGPDLLVTAGHCVVNTGEVRNEKEMYCDVYSWMFDYRANNLGQTKIKGLDKSQLYGCKEIIYAVKDEKAPFRDFALIRLDRPVEGRKPYPMQTKIQEKDRVSMFGHPLGLPLIYSFDANVLENDLSYQTFITNLDAFEGNSGSVVLNSKLEAVGILVGGTPAVSYYTDKGNCYRYNQCDKNGKNCSANDKDPESLPGFRRIGTEVQRIQPIVDLIQSLD